MISPQEGLTPEDFLEEMSDCCLLQVPCHFRIRG
jgi:hypothetical protein